MRQQPQWRSGADVFSRPPRVQERRDHGLEQARPGQLDNNWNPELRDDSERFRDSEEALTAAEELKNTRGTNSRVFFAYRLKIRDYVSVGFGAKVSSNQDQQTRSPKCGLPVLCWIGFVSLNLVRFGQAAPGWESTLTKDPPGNFPELRAIRTTYHFGWSGFTAGTGDIHFTKTADKPFQLDATGRTMGLRRALWRC